MKNSIMIFIMTLLIVGLNATGIAMTYYNKEGGKHIETIIGDVVSVNPGKNVFVVKDEDTGASTTVLTDSQTIASLHPGQTVTVKLDMTSPIAESVAAGD